MTTPAGRDRGVAMALVAGACTILFAVGCPGQPQQEAEAGIEARPEEVAEHEVDVTAARDEAIEAHKAMIDAFARGDVEAFMALLDPTADLLIFHPRSQNRFSGIEEARTRLSGMFEQMGDARWLDVHPKVLVKGDVAWLTTHVLIESSKVEPAFVGRGTEIWVRGDDGWKLVHGHWSRNPEIEANP